MSRPVWRAQSGFQRLPAFGGGVGAKSPQKLISSHIDLAYNALVLFRKENIMVAITQTTVMEASELPPAIRQGIRDGTLVRVVVEELTGVKLRSEVEAELLQCIDDARLGINVTGPFDSAEDLIAQLHADCDHAEEA